MTFQHRSHFFCQSHSHSLTNSLIITVATMKFFTGVVASLTLAVAWGAERFNEIKVRTAIFPRRQLSRLPQPVWPMALLHIALVE